MAKDKGKDKSDEEEDDEGGGGKKKIIMIVGVLATVGAVYNFVLKEPPPEETMQTPEQLAAAMEPAEGEIVEMEEMILNLSGPEAGYLKISLALILDDVTLAADFVAEMAIAKDVAVQYLSAQSPEKFETPEGRQAAKEELSALLRDAYDGEKVVRVLFTSLVMQ